MNRTRFVPSCLSLTLLTVGSLTVGSLTGGSLTAQRGGGMRGPPAEVRERWGNYFTTLTLADGDAQVNDLAKAAHVKDAVTAGHLSVIYLYNSTTDPKKLKAFEQSLFNNSKIQTSLRLFKCARLDLSTNAVAEAKYGKIAPVLLVFDEKGESVGEASMKDLKPAPAPLQSLLTAGTKGYAKVSLDGWVKSYTKWLRDFTNLDAAKKNLEAKRQRVDGTKASDKVKLKKIDDDEAKLNKRRDALLADEGKLLELAKVPPRAEGATLVGEPERRGR